MKRRGAARVVGIDSDERYLAQARFAADVAGVEIEFRQMSVYDVPRSGSASTSCCSWACSTTCAIRCWRSTSSTSTSRETCSSSSRCCAAPGLRRSRPITTSRTRDHFDDPRYPRPALRRARLRGRPDQLVDSEPGVRRGHAAQRRLRHRRAPGGGGLHLPAPDAAGHVARRRGGAAMVEAVMLWNEPNNLSHWDFEIDPDWKLFADGPRPRRRRSQAERPALPRVMGGMSPIDPGFVQTLRAGTARSTRGRRRRPRLPARLEPLADPRMAGQAGRDPGGDRRCRSGCRRSASRRSAPRKCRRSARADGRAAHRAVPSASTGTASTTCRGLAGDDPAPRSGGVLLLPAFLHGAPARGRLAQARADRSATTRLSWGSASGSTSRIRASTMPSAG
jgi:hypothetical protein